MREDSIRDRFAVIALNGQDCNHNTAAKKAAVMGLAAADALQELIDAGMDRDVPAFSERLGEKLAVVVKMRKSKRNALEKETRDRMEAEGILRRIPNLLGCDMNYYTANVTIKEYKSDEEIYTRILESVRAEVLEPGELTLETVCLLWLFRECGCMHDMFSLEEQYAVEQRLVEAKIAQPLYSVILEKEFHSGVVQVYMWFLGWKRNLFKNPYLEGVNLMFPFFDRRQAIFIDLVVLGTKVSERRRLAMDFLREHGHTCEEQKVGGETFVKIDNCYYRIWPATRCYKLPVQGVELLPVYR